MRYLTVVFASVFLALVTAFGVSLVEPDKAEAATSNYAPKCGGGQILLKANEKTMFNLHNQTRANRGLPRLCVHPALQRAARAHSADMIQRDYFAHGNVGARLHNFGYRWRTYGENIAYGSGSAGAPAPIFKSWMNSSGHRANILSGKFREVGIGAVTGTYQGYSGVTMWTADFGTRL